MDEQEARIAADKERAERLRLILHVKETWKTANEMVVIPVPNDGKPKTRDAIVAFFNANRAPHNPREVREHLFTRGIDISTEGVRQHLRRLVSDDELDGPYEGGNYQLALLIEEP